MPLIKMKSAILAIAVALTTDSAQAWSGPLKPSIVKTRKAVLPLRMAKDDIPDKLQITSVNKKELAWDSDKGRFFETNLEEVDCIPDEEFCTIDDDGKPIRLTVAEKERMFLDSLQVRASCLHHEFLFSFSGIYKWGDKMTHRVLKPLHFLVLLRNWSAGT